MTDIEKLNRLRGNLKRKIEPTGTKSNADFSRELQGSKSSVKKVGKFFADKGFRVRIPEIVERPAFGERWEYTDNGDIFLDEEDNEKRKVVEVKHVEKWPKGESDFPFRYVGINEKYKINKFKADIYCIVSWDEKAMLMTETSDSEELWFDYRTKDKKSENREIILVRCPLFKFEKVMLA